MPRLFALLAVALPLVFATWTDLYKFPWTGVPLQLMLAVQCPNASTCLMAGGNSNSASGVYYTNNDFKNATRAQMDHTGLLLTDLRMSSATTAVAGGVGALKLPGLVYTKDSVEFHSADDLWLLEAQSIEHGASANEFYMIGTPNALAGGSGVAVSKNGGVNWVNKDFPASIVQNLPGTVNCSARYGAFVGDTWYISAGSWPASNNNQDSKVHMFNSRVGVHKQSNTLVRRELQARVGDDSGYVAGLIKSTDGGQTFEILASSAGQFYYNDIECIDANTCIVAAEGFSKDGSTNPGAYINRTTDGGKTWTTVLKLADGNSIMRMRCYSFGCWAGTSTASPAQAVFYQSTDNGATWTANGSPIKGVEEVMSIDFVDANQGYAAGITTASVTTPLKYTA